MIRKFLACVVAIAMLSCGGGKHEPDVNLKDSADVPASYGKDGTPDSLYGISDTTKTKDSQSRDQ
jgi:hypothetical protein